MEKILVLAEKPSVGKELARVLGCNRGGEGFLEGDRYVVTWALGHLVTLADPGAYDKAWEKWEMTQLPMLPQPMKTVVIPETGRQYRVVAGLMLTWVDISRGIVIVYLSMWSCNSGLVVHPSAVAVVLERGIPLLFCQRESR